MQLYKYYMVNCNFYIKEMPILNFILVKKRKQLSYALPFYFRVVDL